jgi:predicted PurR-regulated permease PerM
MTQIRSPQRPWPRTLLDVLIRAGVIAILGVACFRVFLPFLDLMLWALILAVTFQPLHGVLRRRLGVGAGGAAGSMVVVALLVLIGPTVMVGTSVAESAFQAAQRLQSEGLHVPSPPESVASWPLVGERVSAVWQAASSDLSALLAKAMPQIEGIAKTLLAQAAGMGVAISKFLLAIVVAGIVMAHGEHGAKTAEAIASRLAGPERGVELVRLSTAIVRAVAQGVIGIAFIQALLLGLGFIVGGVPAPGILVVIVFLLGVMQLPATLVTLPVILYMFTTEMSSGAFLAFAVYTAAAGLADNVLKPLVLGRGVDVPMPVVLIGALGGMVTGGLIGLFIGPVTLALGYALFMAWVDEEAPLATDRQATVPSEGGSSA